jgi:hypothetical protein
LSRKENVTRAADGEIGRYCSSVAMLLTAIKLDDDAVDSGSWVARGARMLLRGRTARARAVLTRLDPHASTTVANYLHQHASLEQRPGPIALEQYAQPTAAAFGYVFGLACKLRGLERHGDILTAIGRHVGAALIAYDCAVDWVRDRRRGEFNPLPDRAATIDSLRFSAAELASAAALCRQHFGISSQAAAILVRVGQRVLDKATSGNACVPAPAWSQAWQIARRVFIGSPLASMAFAGVFASAAGGAAGDALPPAVPGNLRRGHRQGNQGTQQDGSGGGSSCWFCDRGDCGGCDGSCGDCGGCDCSC